LGISLLTSQEFEQELNLLEFGLGLLP